MIKTHVHNLYITYKIVYKSGADSSSRFREITIWKNKFKKFEPQISQIRGLIILPKELDEGYPKSTSTRNFEDIKTILLP